MNKIAFLALRSILLFLQTEFNLLFFETPVREKYALTSAVQDLLSLKYPLQFQFNNPFYISPNRSSIFVCNHIHPSLDIFSLQYMGHLLQIPMTFVGYIDFKETAMSHPFKLCMGLQNLPYGIHTQQQCRWDPSISTWIQRRVNFISLDWDKTTNKPLRGSYEKLKQQGSFILKQGGEEGGHGGSGCGCIVGFPEGTYNGTAQLKHYHTGFFKLALETNTPIYICSMVYQNAITKQLVEHEAITCDRNTLCTMEITGWINIPELTSSFSSSSSQMPIDDMAQSLSNLARNLTDNFIQKFI